MSRIKSISAPQAVCDVQLYAWCVTLQSRVQGKKAPKKPSAKTPGQKSPARKSPRKPVTYESESGTFC